MLLTAGTWEWGSGGQPRYCECVSGCPGWEVRGTLGSWAAEAMFEGQGMELLLTIVQTSAGTPSCLQGIVTQGSLIVTNIYNTTGACCILWQQQLLLIQ